ncbi:MAG: polyphosphate kinase 2, partial [Limibacillus sp.]
MGKDDLDEKPFGGAISEFFENGAPKSVRKAIEDGGKKDILTDGYPYDRWMDGDEYDDQLHELQIELARLQSWVKETGARVAIIFEGRDAAGKGGCIKRF